MNKRLFRTQFNQMENIEKQVLMESLAARYDMTFLGLHTFDHWGQSCTTGIFEKDGRENRHLPEWRFSRFIRNVKVGAGSTR